MSTSKRVTVTEIIDAVDNDEWLLSEDELEDDEFEDHSVLLPTSDYCKKRKMTLKVTPMTPFRLPSHHHHIKYQTHSQHKLIPKIFHLLH